MHAPLPAWRCALHTHPPSHPPTHPHIPRPVDEALAREIREFRSPTDGETRMFYEIVVAPGYTPQGLDVLKGKSKTVREGCLVSHVCSVAHLRTGSAGRRGSAARRCTGRPLGQLRHMPTPAPPAPRPPPPSLPSCASWRPPPAPPLAAACARWAGAGCCRRPTRCSRQASSLRVCPRRSPRRSSWQTCSLLGRASSTSNPTPSPWPRTRGCWAWAAGSPTA